MVTHFQTSIVNNKFWPKLNNKKVNYANFDFFF